VSSDPLSVAKDLAVRAGKLCLRHFGRTEARVKADRSIVTAADLASQRLIARGLRAAFPDHLVLGEEETGGPRDLRSAPRDQFVWVVDPLDGTDGFHAGMPTWGVSIALVRGGEPLLGVFYVPVQRELYWAGEAGPAFLGDREIRATATAADCAGAFLTVFSTFHHGYDVEFPAKVRSMGSTVLHLCYVARGTSCGAVVDGHVWDVAAGMHIVRRAGGVVRYLDGSPLRLRPLLDGSDLPQPALAAPRSRWGAVRRFVGAKVRLKSS
jgi:myo-inositol-1(or 4)-monophosphatase